MQNTSAKRPSEEGWAQGAPYSPSVLGYARAKPLHFQRQTSTRQANPHMLLPGAAQPTPKLGISSPELWLWADPRASPRAVLVAQHRQAADALWCKKSVGWTCPAPHLSPHVTRVPSRGVSPSGSHAPLRLGRLGISPAVPQGLLPHRAEARLQIQPGATARTHSKLGNGAARAGFTKCCL